ncbi:MAG: DUF3307 domain-containing protein [Geminicoccaceae bacterium]
MFPDLNASPPLFFVLALVLAFGLKHLLADYFFQTSWMVHGKSKAAGWTAPLAAHASIHSFGTFVIAMIVAPALWWLAIADLLIHATIDRLRAMPCVGGKLRPDQPAFWWMLGVDQEAHALTHLGFIAVLAATY